MRKLKRTEVLNYKRTLWDKQHGICPLCLGNLGTDMSKIALDHDHVTGECRGLLHLACNKTEGVIFRAVATWGRQGRDYGETTAYLLRLVDYLNNSKTGIIYHLHKDENEQRELRNKRARQARARKAAQARVKA